MGLDISAYKNVKLVEDARLDSEGYPVDDDIYQRVYVNNDFPGRNGQIIDGEVYTYGDDEHSFGAGSYSGYNQWRSQLSQLAGFKDQNDFWENSHDETDFYYLIWFADNEGVIGAECSKKLHEDFIKNKDKAESIGGYFYDKYKHWMKAFELASNNGFVDFH